jgi:hypothetical protein
MVEVIGTGMASNGYLYPNNIGDRVGVGTNTPSKDLEVNDADGDGTAALEIGTVERIEDGGGNLLDVPNSDFQISAGYNLILTSGGVEDNTGALGNGGRSSLPPVGEWNGRARNVLMPKPLKMASRAVSTIGGT